MPGDDRRIPIVACVLLVTLRMSVGWHLLYEGWWKLDTQATPQPWSAEGYLKNAVGPLRTQFRNLTGDPNDFRWLDYDTMVAKWDAWRNRFLIKYGPDDDLTASIDEMLSGVGEFAVPLKVLPSGVKLPPSVTFDGERKALVVDGTLHLIPAERDNLLKQAAGKTEPEWQAFTVAVKQAFQASSRLSYKERLAVSLNADPERVGLLLEDKDGDLVEKRMGDIELYRAQVARYDANYVKAKTPTEFDHLDRQYRDLLDLKRRVVGPVQGLENELKTTADKLLSAAQLARGPVAEPLTPMRSINLQTMWGLAVLGLLLIVGLFTRLAAVGAAGLLLMFYLAAPPWPGVPEVPGPEHNYIVNKVYLESLTCLLLAALPTGQWFGMDALWSGWFRKKA